MAPPFDDINGRSQWERIMPIQKGFSPDLKYMVVTNRGMKCFLRILEDTDHAKQLVAITDDLVAFGIPTPPVIDSGSCADGSKYFILQEWIDGTLLENALPEMPKKEQYLLGVRAGEILLKIHSCLVKKFSDWKTERFKKYEASLKRYREAGISYEYEERIDQFIRSNLDLLETQTISLVHGDYHVGNMIRANRQLHIIDFDRVDYKTPMEDFYKLGIFSRNVSIDFCKGQIDGYTNCRPTDTFWAQYNLCMAMTCFLSLLWGKDHSNEMALHRKKLCDMVVADHGCFKLKKPKWYTSS